MPNVVLQNLPPGNYNLSYTDGVLFSRDGFDIYLGHRLSTIMNDSLHLHGLIFVQSPLSGQAFRDDLVFVSTTLTREIHKFFIVLFCCT